MSLLLEGVGHRYGGEWALRGVSVQVEPGEVLAVVGPSGSGKTTLLRLVCGLIEPDEGSVVIDGAPMAGVAPERRPVAMVFQGFALFPHLSVRDNIAFGLRVRRVPRAEREARVLEAAGRLGLTELLDRLPPALSGGERQRAALARALVRDPAVFCLDEPLSALDPLLRTDARRELADLLRADGRCAVFVTHDQAEALTLGDRVAVLRAGRLEQVATPRALYDAPATAFVASFVGTPAMSLLRDGILGPGLCGVRPEHVLLVPGDDATVRAVEDHGHEAHVLLAVAGGQLTARVAVADAPAVGSRTGVRIDPAHVHVFPADHGVVAQQPRSPGVSQVHDQRAEG
ncbi:MAG: ABC transporter ATP-binding protein [Frankiales bacterium]|nr:ABC transporter ATP-binding protein [Frankiales bacterium]